MLAVLRLMLPFVKSTQRHNYTLAITDLILRLCWLRKEHGDTLASLYLANHFISLHPEEGLDLRRSSLVPPSSPFFEIYSATRLDSTSTTATPMVAATPALPSRP